jgi:hypothetical protein
MKDQFVQIGDSLINRAEVRTAYPCEHPVRGQGVKIEFVQGGFRIITDVTIEGTLSKLNGAAF